MYQYDEYNYLKRLATLIGSVVLLTIVIAYVPKEFGPVRGLFSLIQFGFIIVTLAVTARWVLEDY